MKSKDIGREVLNVYQKESPSAIGIEDANEFNKFSSGQKRLWQDFMKIPMRTFNDAVVLDYGCGTGEIDVFLATYGAKVRGVDFNPNSIERAQELAKHFSLAEKLEFKVADIHAPAYQNDIADFAISLGVLPHVYDPEKVFANMIDSCKDNAFIVLGFVEELGIIQRLLHRSIVRAIAGFDEDKIIEIARQAFPDHISRSIKYGQRTERSVIFDYLVNRHMYGLPLERVLGWFDKNNVSYYSSWPSIELPFEINPYTSARLSLMHPVWKEYRSLIRLRWLFTQREDSAVFGTIAEILNAHIISKHIDNLSSILASLVQEQSSVWNEGELKNLDNIGKEIVKEMDNQFKNLCGFIEDGLNTSIDALKDVVSNVFKLQKHKVEEFTPVAGLFRELNGLGTFYLAGIIN